MDKNLTKYIKRVSKNCSFSKDNLIEKEFIRLFKSKNNFLNASSSEVAVAMRRVFGFDSVVLANAIARLFANESNKDIEMVKLKIIEMQGTIYSSRPAFLKTINNRG